MSIVRMPVLLAALLLAACASSPTPIYLTLAAPYPAPVAQPGQRAVLVGPVSLPELHDRPQVMLQISPHRVEPIANMRWAQPYRQEMARSLAARLALAAANPRIVPGTATAPAEPHLRLAVDVLSLEARAGEAVHLDVLWTLRESGGSVVASRRSQVHAALSATGAEALAAAHGSAIAALANEIAPLLR